MCHECIHREVCMHRASKEANTDATQGSCPFFRRGL